MIWETGGLILAAYLAGSVNFSIIIFKILGRDDPRKGFSGNPGTSNVYRQAGVFWAVAVLLLDIGRAMGIACAALIFLKIDFVPWVGLTLIVGNRFPCFHGFQGGKGVANYLGFTVVITPLLAGLSALAWVVVYGIGRKSFIASFCMILVLASGTIVAIQESTLAILGVVLTSLFIFYNHKPNIVNMLQSKADLI
jgi:acyl phosphate:glycerol-3-phosphate acyltransferase